MKRIPLLLILSFSISIFSKAAGEYKIIGARAVSLGHCSVSIADSWSAFNNQAGLAQLKSTSAGIYYENRFLVKELGLSAASFNMPLKQGTIALSVTHFGFEAWNENKFGFAYARAFGNKLSIGAQLDYLVISQEESYKTLNFITFEVGMILEVSGKFNLGIHAYNPINAGISEFTDEKCPGTFRLGTLYKASGQFHVLAEVEKSTDSDPILRAGIEYEVLPATFIRTGISTEPSFWSFGAGTTFKRYTIDISSSFHAVLGFSPQISVTYKFK